MSRRPIDPRIDPRAGDAPATGTPDALREAMAHWASGVAVVGVRDEDEVVGLTVSAFASLSLDPPLVLACIGEQAAILPYLQQVGRFTVNLLGEDARALASRFSQMMPDDPGLFEPGDPILLGSVASLVCGVDAIHPGGDHRIVIGAVERVVLGADRPPLLYYRREYRRLR